MGKTGGGRDAFRQTSQCLCRGKNRFVTNFVGEGGGGRGGERRSEADSAYASSGWEGGPPGGGEGVVNKALVAGLVDGWWLDPAAGGRWPGAIQDSATIRR